MGKINSGISGSFSGRLGNVVGYQWRGKQCVRTLPGEFHDAKTPMQLEQRNLFGQTVAFAGRAKEVLHEGLRLPSIDMQMTECNYFMRINKRCFSLVDGVLNVDFSELVISDGPVAPVAFGTVSVVDEQTLVVDFEKNPLHRVASSEDKVYLAAYCPDLNSFALSQPARRGAKSLEMRFLPAYVGKEIHLWGFVQDKAGRASLSEYIGCGILGEMVTENETDGVELSDEATGNSTAVAPDTIELNSKSRPSTGERSAYGSGTPPDR
ncbi:MAG: hypothetical protein J6031_05550 [Bacteroidales bacterium]|nr:hypothetical protein [Bacteroidales bacterium]